MRILFIASTDSYNTELLALAKAAKIRGYYPLILFTHPDESNNRMLYDEQINNCYWHEFDQYDKFDVIVYGNILNSEVCKQVRSQNCLKIGLFFHLVIDDYVIGGENLFADFTLCYGRRFIENQIKNGIKHNFVALGPPFEPKHNTVKNKAKNILFLEQHFYPSGDKGKQQLADMLTGLAHALPDHTITVKPRALETDKNPKHKARHIYSYLKNTPKNLVLLRTPCELEEEIDKADIVTTTFSTAVTPALLKDKPTLFIKGFSMKETQYYNKAMVTKYFNIYKDSGNLVHYKDIVSRIDSASPVNSEFKNNLFFNRKGDFPNAALDFMEYARAFRGYSTEPCNIDNYRNTISDKNPVVNPRDLHNNIEIERFYLLNLVSGFRLENNRMQLVSALAALKNSRTPITEYQKCASEIGDEAIQASIRHLLKHYRNHPVGFKGYYLKHLFKKQDEKSCDQLPPSWRIADYYYNKYLFNVKNKDKARFFLGKYLNIAKKEDYKLTHLYENSFIHKSEDIYTKEFQ